jgi:hypothetical protein
MAYKVDGWPGIAFNVIGPEELPDEDTEWSGIGVETGRMLVCMVGDDRTFAVDPEDIWEISDDDYCGGCGQIGCPW